MTDTERREVARSCDRCEYRPVCSTRRTCGDSAWCCSTYKKRIDRDALLALAEEYEKSAKLARTYKWSDPTCASMAAMLADEHGKFARRIREAIGEKQ